MTFLGIAAEPVVAVPLLYGLTYVLNAYLPGTATKGYVLQPDSSPYTYTLNGLRVLLVTCAFVYHACTGGHLDATFVYRRYAECCVAAFVAGLAFSAAVFHRGLELVKEGRIDRRARCATVDQSKHTTANNTDTSEFDSRSALTHFFCGLSDFNPRFWPGVDIKMWLYVVGAVQLQLNILSAAAAHVQARASSAASLPGISLGGWGSVGYGMAMYAGCFTFFLLEYMAHEHVHLYTYDIFRERIGLKLAWGCLCFYPFFYCIGVLPLVNPRHDITGRAALLCAALYFAGWILTRGANLQKYYLKQGASSFMGMPLETVPGSQGRLLCTGFWAHSRHINYLGEIVQAAALALPGYLATSAAYAGATGWEAYIPYLPWLYPLYYVALFIPRQLDDDAMCAAKYGKVWEEYCRRVPYRIVPWLY